MESKLNNITLIKIPTTKPNSWVTAQKKVRWRMIKVEWAFCSLSLERSSFDWVELVTITWGFLNLTGLQMKMEMDLARENRPINTHNIVSLYATVVAGRLSKSVLCAETPRYFYALFVLSVNFYGFCACKAAKRLKVDKWLNWFQWTMTCFLKRSFSE